VMILDKDDLCVGHTGEFVGLASHIAAVKVTKCVHVIKDIGIPYRAMAKRCIYRRRRPRNRSFHHGPWNVQVHSPGQMAPWKCVTTDED
jgi:hypothetical protein